MFYNLNFLIIKKVFRFLKKKKIYFTNLSNNQNFYYLIFLNVKPNLNFFLLMFDTSKKKLTNQNNNLTENKKLSKIKESNNNIKLVKIFAQLPLGFLKFSFDFLRNSYIFFSCTFDKHYYINYVKDNSKIDEILKEAIESNIFFDKQFFNNKKKLSFSALLLHDFKKYFPELTKVFLKYFPELSQKLEKEIENLKSRRLAEKLEEKKNQIKIKKSVFKDF